MRPYSVLQIVLLHPHQHSVSHVSRGGAGAGSVRGARHMSTERNLWCWVPVLCICTVEAHVWGLLRFPSTIASSAAYR